MVPRGGVTSTLTFLLTAIAPSYAALPMHCVYVCGNCNLTPMALCDATEAVGPGLPPRSTPCGASGAQSFDTCDRALGLNVSTWAPSTRNSSSQGLASADDAQGFSELAKAFTQLLAVDVEPALPSWARSTLGGLLLVSIMSALLAVVTCSRPSGLKFNLGLPGVPAQGKLARSFEWVVCTSLRLGFAFRFAVSVARQTIGVVAHSMLHATCLYCYCLLVLLGIAWRGKHVSLQASMRDPCDLNLMSALELLAECGVAIGRSRAFCDPYGNVSWEFDSDDTAFMMMADIQDNNDWDAKKYPACPPYHGKRGTKFEAWPPDTAR